MLLCPNAGASLAYAMSSLYGTGSSQFEPAMGGTYMISWPRRPHRWEVRDLFLVLDDQQADLSRFFTAPGQPDEALPDGGGS